MATESGAYRWWENYLVRYLMPSIAGVAIVNWLAVNASQGFKEFLLIGVGASGLQAPTLVLLFLYGNLFCYVSSYPILVFHVTRVIDPERGTGRRKIWDGYFSTMLLASILLLLSIFIGWNSNLNQIIPFLAALVFSCIQLYRIYLALDKVTFDGINGQVSKIFAYTYAISKRRSIVEELSITKQSNNTQNNDEPGDMFDEEREWQKRSAWQRELIDSYRHMREHGNSAFIFVLELTLASLCYLLLVACKDQSASYQLTALGLLFAVWALPAMFIHLVGQHIERRFSWYDRKVNPTPSPRNEP
jgi:hypothetical protein